MGLHSGGAIAGVIGHKTFQYDLCGDAVNTAARMCSTSEPGRVHVSETTHALLKHQFDAEDRGEREVKGKGRMHTYFVHNAPPGAISAHYPALMPPQAEAPALMPPPPVAALEAPPPVELAASPGPKSEKSGSSNSLVSSQV